jgi:hypothetical protein
MSDMSEGFVYGLLTAGGLTLAALWAALFVAVREKQPSDCEDPD